jgi:hypothetical protein
VTIVAETVEPFRFSNTRPMHCLENIQSQLSLHSPFDDPNPNLEVVVPENRCRKFFSAKAEWNSADRDSGQDWQA